MSTKPDSQSPPEAPEVVGKTGIGRRRLLRAGLSAAPVVLALSGRSAMGTPTFSGGCPKGLSPLAWASVVPDGANCGVMSHTVGRNDLGKKPARWIPNTGTGKTFGLQWPTGVVPFSAYVAADWANYVNIPIDSPLWATGTKYRDVFTATLSGESRSFSQILLDPSGVTTTTRLCVAYLNALRNPTTYSMTPQEVIDAERGALVINGLDAFLEQTW